MKRLVVCLLVGLSFYSCGKDDKAPSVTTVNIESLSPEGCLSIPSYFSSIQGLDQNMPVLEVTTDFSYSSKKYVREKFGDLMAYSTFRAGARLLSQFTEFNGLSQNGCSSLVFHSADSSEETFPITAASRESITAQSEDGRSYTYTWLSPTRMAIDIRYNALDLPCGSEEPVLIRQRRVLDWSQTPITSLDLSADPYNMSRSYLTLVAGAVGFPAADLYDGDKILPEKVQAMAARPPRSDLLTCSAGELPPPPNSPDDPEVPTEP